MFLVLRFVFFVVLATILLGCPDKKAPETCAPNVTVEVLDRSELRANGAGLVGTMHFPANSPGWDSRLVLASLEGEIHPRDITNFWSTNRISQQPATLDLNNSLFSFGGGLVVRLEQTIPKWSSGRETFTGFVDDYTKALRVQSSSHNQQNSDMKICHVETGELTLKTRKSSWNVRLDSRALMRVQVTPEHLVRFSGQRKVVQKP